MGKHVFRGFIFVSIFMLVHGSIVERRFKRLESDAILTSSQPQYLSRTSIECLQACGRIPDTCGVNYVKSARRCTCFTRDEFVSYELASVNTGSVYVIDTCAQWTSNSTSSSTRTPVDSGTTTDQPFNTQPTSTVSSSRTPDLETSSLTVTETTAASTSGTTVPQGCFPSAMLCHQDVVMMFIGSDVRTYSSVNDLITQPLSQYRVTSLFASVNDLVTSAYADNSNAYLFVGSSVQTYLIINSTIFSFESDQSAQTFFGGVANDVPQIPDAVIHLTSSKARHLFSNDTVTVLEANGRVKTCSLGNNGAQNPYKSSNNQFRPLNVVAACELNSDIHIFVSNGNVYSFKFSDSVWSNHGVLMC